MRRTSPKRTFLVGIVLCAISVTGHAEAEIITGFTPTETARNAVINLINDSKKMIYMEAYQLTNKKITRSLLDAHYRGVDVKIIADAKSIKDKFSTVKDLAIQGVNVRLNGNYSHMHNKVIISDNINVQTGSFNYTESAVKRNAENIVVIRNNDEVAAAYLAEFSRLWHESYPLIVK